MIGVIDAVYHHLQQLRAARRDVDNAIAELNKLKEDAEKEGWWSDPNHELHSIRQQIEEAIDKADPTDITEHLAEVAKVLNSSGYHTAAANTRKGIEVIGRLTKERDYAARNELRLFRRVQELEDRNRQLEDEAAARRGWLYRAKRARGYDDNVSFDRVWAETCAKADLAVPSPKGQG